MSGYVEKYTPRAHYLNDGDRQSWKTDGLREDGRKNFITLNAVEYRVVDAVKEIRTRDGRFRFPLPASLTSTMVERRMEWGERKDWKKIQIRRHAYTEMTAVVRLCRRAGVKPMYACGTLPSFDKPRHTNQVMKAALQLFRGRLREIIPANNVSSMYLVQDATTKSVTHLHWAALLTPEGDWSREERKSLTYELTVAWRHAVQQACEQEIGYRPRLNRKHALWTKDFDLPTAEYFFRDNHPARKDAYRGEVISVGYNENSDQVAVVIHRGGVTKFPAYSDPGDYYQTLLRRAAHGDKFAATQLYIYRASTKGIQWARTLRRPMSKDAQNAFRDAARDKDFAVDMMRACEDLGAPGRTVPTDDIDLDARRDRARRISRRKLRDRSPKNIDDREIDERAVFNEYQNGAWDQERDAHALDDKIADLLANEYTEDGKARPQNRQERRHRKHARSERGRPGQEYGQSTDAGSGRPDPVNHGSEDEPGTWGRDPLPGSGIRGQHTCDTGWPDTGGDPEPDPYQDQYLEWLYEHQEQREAEAAERIFAELGGDWSSGSGPEPGSYGCAPDDQDREDRIDGSAKMPGGYRSEMEKSQFTSGSYKTGVGAHEGSPPDWLGSFSRTIGPDEPWRPPDYKV